jgi:hypothetical protein
LLVIDGSIWWGTGRSIWSWYRWEYLVLVQREYVKLVQAGVPGAGGGGRTWCRYRKEYLVGYRWEYLVLVEAELPGAGTGGSTMVLLN